MPREPAELFIPGEFIQEELDARGWSHQDLATKMNADLRLVNTLVSGGLKITPEIASSLGEAFDVARAFFLNLAVGHRRRKILDDAVQLRRDVDSYNENNPWQEPIQMDLDFTRELDLLVPRPPAG